MNRSYSNRPRPRVTVRASCFLFYTRLLYNTHAREEKLEPLSMMGWFAELGAMAAPGFPIGKQLFQQISIPCKTAFLLFLCKKLPDIPAQLVSSWIPAR